MAAAVGVRTALAERLAMSGVSVPRIHPSAIVAAQAELAPDVQVAANCVIEGKVRVGPGCHIEERAYLVGPLVLGADNRVCTGAVLGERAQHLRHDQPCGLEIGPGNVFRAGVTIHQGTQAPTRIGTGNRFLVDAHIAHDCRVGDGCIFAAGALVGGHCVVGPGVRIGRRAVVHQFCRLGRLCRLRPGGLTTKDIPPFMLQDGNNTIIGVNRAGMRRGGCSAEQVRLLEQVYEIVYLSGLTFPSALADLERRFSDSPVATEFVAFIRTSERGVNHARVNL
jgi:UDP-N-acetylglucosamine acyltransferase